MTSHQLREAYIKVDDLELYSAYLRTSEPRTDNLTAVIMHGAGRASSSRYTQLAQEFANEGLSVVLLDFIGHGKTGGNIADNSLQKRTTHALAAIKYWTSDTTPLILCGFSMSGHTALRTAGILGDRVNGLGLFCPAVYAAEAETLAFGPEFTELIRTPESWRDSLALKDAARFAGRAAIVIGDEDEVIPKEVISSLKHVLGESSTELHVEILPGVTHQLAKWLTAHESQSRAIVRYLVGEKE